MADKQKRNVYDAEFSIRRVLDLARQGDGTLTIHGSKLTLQRERLFGSIESVQQYVDGVRSLSWFAELWPEQVAREVRVRKRRGNAKAHHEIADDGSSVIAVYVDPTRHTWALRELVILHELAHSVTPRGVESHGPEFCGNFLLLVEHVLGPEVRMILSIEYFDQGVKWTATGSSRPSAASTT